MATNAERAAAIRKATLAAVTESHQLGQQMIEEIIIDYTEAGEEIELRIQHAAAGDDQISIERLQGLLGDIRKELDDLGRRRDGKLYRSLEAAAGLGVRPFVGELSSSSIAAINHAAVRFVRTFAAADGLQLSERLWRLDQHADRALAGFVQRSVIQGMSAHQAVMSYLGPGADVPAEVARDLAAARPGAIRQHVRAFMTGAPDPVTGKGVVYQAERVFRTEINRARGEAYIASALSCDGVVGVRFRLSPRHRRADVCDRHATADLYGLGPGVYPTREACPWPAHPNTLSYVEVVFGDDSLLI